MKRNNYYYWIKLQRRYRNTQIKWIENQDKRIARKLDILGRRIHALNHKWNVGIATSVLSAWLAVMPATEIKAQGSVFPATIELSALDGSTGFTLNGVADFDQSGASVSSAGDINGDGVDDLIIGASGADPNGSYSGASYVVFGSIGGFATTIELSSLNGTNGFTLNGADGDNSGFSVSPAGDVNGDGVDDLIIGAHGADPNGNSSGASYVVFGSSSAFASTLELSNLNGSDGFILNGVAASDQAGVSVSGAGDMNGDGVDDLIIGAHFANPNGNYSGETYVVFGSSSGFASTFELSSLNGSNGFTLNGEAVYNSSGRSVSGAGDVNADGMDDVIIGTAYAEASYLVFGSSSGFAATIELSGLNGTNGFTLNGVAAGDQLGGSVSGAGDVNDDGVDDLIIGARLADPNGNYSGETYVVFGSSSGFTSVIELSGLNGTNGFTLNGVAAGDQSGGSVNSAGDVNDDGIADLVIGARGAGPNGSYSGASYVVFGSSGVFASAIELSALDGTNGFTVNGVAADHASGGSVSGAGDINGDGVADLLIGAPSADPNGSNSGENYVVFGIPDPARVELSRLNGTNGFVLNGIDAGDGSGYSVSGAGDVNGDGVGDLLIGAWNADPNGNLSAGETYVVFGQTGGFPASMNLSELDGSNGFVLNGIDGDDASGNSVSGAGDVNGDGVDDLLIGAQSADPNGNSNAGETYVVFGQTGGFPASMNLSGLDGSNGFVLNGIDGDDRSGIPVSGAGDVNGDGVDDLLIGAVYGDPNGNSYAGETYVVFGQTGGFPASLELSGLDGSNGFVLNGIDANDRSGRSVSGAGDVNGDGLDDLLIGANGGGPNGNSAAGETYVVFGQTSGFPASLDLSGLDGSNGFVLNGIDVTDQSGFSVSGAGDVNGDGVDDLLIGAWSADPNGNSFAGETYVVFGQTNGFPASMNLSGLDGNNGFVLNGIDVTDRSGRLVSSAGDVNGDGVDDLLIGASGGDPNGNSSAGETYVVFGQTGGFPASLDLSGLDGGNGFVLNGIDDNDRSGISVNGAGDVNGDGVDDLLIGAYAGAPNGPGSGETYVVFGIQGPAAPTVANTIPDQQTDEDQVFDFMVPDNTFDDINTGDVLTLSATLVGGGDLPFWLTFTPGTETFSGTPANDDVSTISIEVTATDPGGLFVSDIFDLEVVNTNDAPVLTGIGAQSGDEGTEITFTALATDVDLPANTLMFSLDAPSLGLGMTIDASTGAFSWTPTESQNGNHNVTVTVSDGILTDAEIVTITVNKVDAAPVLEAIGAQSGDGGVEITFTASATDVDLPVNTLTFSLDATSLGKGMTIDASTGAFSWTPSEAQSGNHDVTVTVSDGTLTDSEMVTITVTGSALGINELSSINVYPNPVRDRLEIVGLTKAHTAIFHSLAGVTVLQQQVKDGFIDVRPLENGVYIVDIKDDAEQIILRSRILKTN